MIGFVLCSHVESEDNACYFKLMFVMTIPVIHMKET